jgi:hypothetical protein
MSKLRRELSFNDLFKVVGCSYRSVDIRTLAVKPDSEWTNAITVIYPTLVERDMLVEDQKRLEETMQKIGVAKVTHAKFLRELITSEALPDLVAQMSKGTFTIDNQSIRLREGYDRSQIFDCERHTLGIREYPVSGYYIFAKDSAESFMGNLKLENDFLSVGQHILEFACNWLELSSLTLAFNAILALPMYVSLLSVKYPGDGNVLLQVKVHGSLVPRFRLILSLERLDGRVNRSVPLETFADNLSSFPSNEQREFMYLNVSHKFKMIPSEGDFLRVKIFDEILGIVIEKSNQIREIHAYTSSGDPFLNTASRFVDTSLVENYLIRTASTAKPGKTSDAFERAVTWLLSFLGLRTVELGDLGLGVLREEKYEVGETDILAEDTVTHQIYVISCSLKPPGAEKVDKIANVAGNLREKGLTVEPLMFVGEPAGEVKRNVRRVKVLDRDDLHQVAQTLRTGNLLEARRIVLEPTAR